MKVTPVLLIILDGFGHREECEFNAICQARKPHWNFLWATHPHTFIDASEKWVGLPPARSPRPAPWEAASGIMGDRRWHPSEVSVASSESVRANPGKCQSQPWKSS